MKTQLNVLRLLFFCQIFLLLVQAGPLMAQGSDQDGDGITDEVEINGWSNSSGGPYFTNPNDPDSDDDGLTDGEEQLFNTKPLDQKHPGIHARYSDTFQAKKYYSWIKYGSTHIAHGTDKYKTAIVRRGTAIDVGGRSGATLEIIKSIDALTTLSPVQNSSNSWTVSIPSDATVGKYTLKLRSGSWNKTLTLYVIFEISPDLSPAEVAAYVYSDDLADDRDGYAIWFDANPGINTNLDPGYEYFGKAFAFQTDQYMKYLLENYVIPTVNGLNNVQAAFEALSHKTDQVTRFDVDVEKYNMKPTLNSFENRCSCQDIACVGVGFLRSIGIAARPIKVDWKIRYYDTSTEVWIGGQWLTVRLWNDAGETNIANPIEGGIFGPHDQFFHGHSKYKVEDAVMLGVMRPNWQWSEVNNNAHCGSGRRAYRGWFLPEMGEEYPPLAPGNIKHVLGWQPMTIPYWGWPSEPSTDSLLSYGCGSQIVGMPVAPFALERLPEAQGSGWTLSAWLPYLLCIAAFLQLLAILRSRSSRPAVWGAALSGSAVLILAGTWMLNSSGIGLSAKKVMPKPAVFGKVVKDYGLDQNGNGRYDVLVVEVQVDVKKPGYYTVIGHLGDSNPTPDTVGGYLASASAYTLLAAGTQTVKIEFRGQTIYKNGADGTYTLDELWLTDRRYPEDVELLKAAIDYASPGYRTAAYSRDNFENGGASLVGDYSHLTLDSNHDGYFDSLVVNTSLQINTPGVYRVEADLVDKKGNWVATASWSGSGNQVSLSFNTLLGDVTSYSLRNVNLYNAKGYLIDSTAESDDSESDVYATGSLYNLGLEELGPEYADPQVIRVTLRGGDKNANFQGLDVLVKAAVAVQGAYRLEAWVESGQGALVAWETGKPVHLIPGLRDLALSFKGRTIKGFKESGPYKLVALRLLFGDYTVIDQVDVAYDPLLAAKTKP